jgi:hypothetical protein
MSSEVSAVSAGSAGSAFRKRNANRARAARLSGESRSADLVSVAIDTGSIEGDRARRVGLTDESRGSADVTER